jgi:putative redox protein
MGSATLKWIGGFDFVGIGSNGRSVVLSGGDEAVGVKPSEMLLVALASCSSVDVVEILAKKRKPLSFMEVLVSSENDPDPPWTFRKIKVTYRLAGKNLTEKAVSQAIALSRDKYCSVAATLRATAEIVTEFEIISEKGITIR